jgi:hypothetical protein
LNDKRNCISEYARIKKAVPKEFVQIWQGEIAADPNSMLSIWHTCVDDIYLWDINFLKSIFRINNVMDILFHWNSLILFDTWTCFILDHYCERDGRFD